MGTTTGLNLTDMEEADAIASRIATAYNSSATGANLAAQQLGSGLSQQVIPSFGSNDTSLGQAAFALASGIGNATAVGLGLTQQRFEPNPDSSIEGVAGNFGLGVAMPIVSNINFQALMRSLGNSSSASKLMQQLPRIAAAAGIGLGKGARNGLGLKADDDNKENSGRVQRRQSRNDTASSGNNVPRAVKLFAKGLSQSFIQGSNFSTLNSAVGAAFPNSFDLRAMLGPLAAGAGAGIGTGAAIGFNFKPVDTTPTIAGNITKDEQQTALAAEAFTQNLLSNFLVNSSAIQKAKQFIVDGPSQAFKGVDGAKAAEGFARGTIEGVMNAMSSVGGLKNLISGDVPADAFENVPVLSPTQFNDSVNGAAVGFARGLTGKATILVAAIARNFTQGTQGSGDTIPGRKRSISTGIEEASVGRSECLEIPLYLLTISSRTGFALHSPNSATWRGSATVSDRPRYGTDGSSKAHRFSHLPWCGWYCFRSFGHNVHFQTGNEDDGYSNGQHWSCTRPDRPPSIAPRSNHNLIRGQHVRNRH